MNTIEADQAKMPSSRLPGTFPTEPEIPACSTVCPSVDMPAVAESWIMVGMTRHEQPAEEKESALPSDDAVSQEVDGGVVCEGAGASSDSQSARPPSIPTGISLSNRWSDTSAVASCKELEVERLNDEQKDEDSDEDSDSDISSIPEDQRMQWRYKREEERLSRLVRDKAPVVSESQDCKSCSDGDAAKDDEQYLMSGALEPIEMGPMPAQLGPAKLIVSDGECDADLEPTKPPFTDIDQQQQPLPSAVSKCADDRETPREVAGKQSPSQQLLTNLNKKLTGLPLRWRKRQKSTSVSDGDMDFQCIGVQYPQVETDIDEERWPESANFNDSLRPPPKNTPAKMQTDSASLQRVEGATYDGCGEAEEDEQQTLWDWFGAVLNLDGGFQTGADWDEESDVNSGLDDV